MTWTIILDFLVLGLLGTSIGYAIYLNKRLTTIQDSRQELQKFMENFIVSLNKAESSVQELKGTGQNVIDSIFEPLNKAKVLRDELAFLVEKGNGLADQLETSIRTAKTLQKAGYESSTLSASNDRGPNLPEINPDIILSLKNIR